MPTGSSRLHAKRGRPRGLSRTSTASSRPGWRRPPSSASPPALRRPTCWSSGSLHGWGTGGTPASRRWRWPQRPSTFPSPGGWTDMASSVHALADPVTAGVSSLEDYLGACAARVDAEIALVLDAEVEDPWLRGAINYHFGWAGADF